jgi:hypothetical protein
MATAMVLCDEELSIFIDIEMDELYIYLFKIKWELTSLD